MTEYQIKEGQKFARFTNSGWDMTTVQELPERPVKWYVNPVTRFLILWLIAKPLLGLIKLSQRAKRTSKPSQLKNHK